MYRIERSVLISKNDLHPNPWNPNRTSERVQEAIKESVTEYGQVLELLVRPHPEIEGEYQILDGEHRYNVLPENVYCNVIHDVPESHARKLTVIMNETRGEADKIALAQLLAEVSQELDPEELLKALPYDAGELNELVKLAEVDWDQFDDSVEDTTEEENEPDQELELESFMALVDVQTMELLNQAKALVSENQTLSKDYRIAWGEVLSGIVNDYLATGTK